MIGNKSAGANPGGSGGDALRIREIISFTDVDFSYNGAPVLEGVSFGVERGDFATIIGPNGGGKTTLAKLMLGLLEPDRGDISVLGVSPVRSSRKIGYVPQYSQFDPQFPITVLDVVLMGRLSKPIGFYGRGDREAAEKALEDVSMGGFEHRSFAELSGGQRQRILVARALAGNPEVLLMDEPTSSVDTSVEEKLKEMLNRLNSYLTILLITHDLGFVSTCINKIVCVNRVVHMHEPREVTPELLSELYGTPVHFVDHTTGMDACDHD